MRIFTGLTQLKCPYSGTYADKEQNLKAPVSDFTIMAFEWNNRLFCPNQSGSGFCRTKPGIPFLVARGKRTTGVFISVAFIFTCSASLYTIPFYPGRLRNCHRQVEWSAVLYSELWLGVPASHPFLLPRGFRVVSSARHHLLPTHTYNYTTLDTVVKSFFNLRRDYFPAHADVDRPCRLLCHGHRKSDHCD